MTNIATLGLGSIPRVTNWEYATATARMAATGFVATDIGKLAKQTDDGSLWELTAVTPTWAQIGGGSNLQLDITVNAEDSDTVEVDIQVKDSSGNELSDFYVFTMWLSDNSANPALTSTAPDTEFSLSDGTILHTYTTDKMLEVATDDSGILTVYIEHTGAKTWYLYFKMPDGTITISDVITFT